MGEEIDLTRHFFMDGVPGCDKVLDMKNANNNPVEIIVNGVRAIAFPKPGGGWDVWSKDARLLALPKRVVDAEVAKL